MIIGDDYIMMTQMTIVDLGSVCSVTHQNSRFKIAVNGFWAIIHILAFLHELYIKTNQL